ncbi:MAG: hypothetical protein ACKOAD_03375 [Gammaproteobacteria bacterium]
MSSQSLPQTLRSAYLLIENSLTQKPKHAKARYTLAQAYYQVARDDITLSNNKARLNLNSAISLLQKDSRPTYNKLLLLVKAYDLHARLMRNQGELDATSYDLTQIILRIDEYSNQHPLYLTERETEPEVSELYFIQLDAIIQHLMLLKSENPNLSQDEALMGYFQTSTSYIIRTLEDLESYQNPNPQDIYQRLAFTGLIISFVERSLHQIDHALGALENTFFYCHTIVPNTPATLSTKILIFGLCCLEWAAVHYNIKPAISNEAESNLIIAEFYHFLFSCFAHQNNVLRKQQSLSFEQMFLMIEFITEDPELLFGFPYLLVDLIHALKLLELGILQKNESVNEILQAEYYQFNLSDYLNNTVVHLHGLYFDLFFNSDEEVLLDNYRNTFEKIWFEPSYSIYHFYQTKTLNTSRKEAALCN